jgi:hypothetical protein
MPRRPYTAHDTPELVERIDRDVATVVDTVRRADPGLRSLVLTGGFARGEGAVLEGAPQNDYDFVAVRGLRRPSVPYERLRADLEARLGLHVDLAPVAAWRLGWVSPSIFWYETALRGRVVWGDDLLARIPVRSPAQVDPAEGLRLLVNRAAGLLLYSEAGAPARRLQAAKALLAAADVHLLARGEFPPSQTERWQRIEALRASLEDPAPIKAFAPWLEWAHRFKLSPADAPARDADDAWRAAASAVLDAVPVALRHAHLNSLDAYARRDGLLDRWVYWRRAARIEGARRLLKHPTGRVRVATLRLLEASLDGRVAPEAAKRYLGPLVPDTRDPLRVLHSLRNATLQ